MDNQDNNNPDWAQSPKQLTEQSSKELQAYKNRLEQAWAQVMQLPCGEFLRRWFDDQCKSSVGPKAEHMYFAGYQDAFKLILGIITNAKGGEK